RTAAAQAASSSPPGPTRPGPARKNSPGRPLPAAPPQPQIAHPAGEPKETEESRFMPLRMRDSRPHAKTKLPFLGSKLSRLHGANRRAVGEPAMEFWRSSRRHRGSRSHGKERCEFRGGVAMVEARLRRFDGAYRWFLCRTVPLRNEAGAIVKWFSVSIDIEDRKRTEEEIRSTQTKLAQMGHVLTMGQLTASIAHEVNQPLPVSGIITNANTCLHMLAANPPNVEGARE